MNQLFFQNPTIRLKVKYATCVQILILGLFFYNIVSVSSEYRGYTGNGFKTNLSNTKREYGFFFLTAVYGHGSSLDKNSRKKKNVSQKKAVQSRFIRFVPLPLPHPKTTHTREFIIMYTASVYMVYDGFTHTHHTHTRLMLMCICMYTYTRKLYIEQRLFCF